eukprot:CAMPEP_0184484064 /NCGR_PEP_ID=MMETSP0113_2-20130426/5764_1 /TAXON_ID=91329 /ORGANISM="Norrisiella sphaerica, Strain BC52" /LENGTH=307 /DNA_ID=CAMNT_0026864841 /DNA_START=45 /DNA_END=968 /DNA_ORIENTATION=-
MEDLEFEANSEQFKLKISGQPRDRRIKFKYPHGIRVRVAKAYEAAFEGGIFTVLLSIESWGSFPRGPNAGPKKSPKKKKMRGKGAIEGKLRPYGESGAAPAEKKMSKTREKKGEVTPSPSKKRKRKREGANQEATRPRTTENKDGVRTKSSSKKKRKAQKSTGGERREGTEGANALGGRKGSRDRGVSEALKILDRVDERREKKIEQIEQRSQMKKNFEEQKKARKKKKRKNTQQILKGVEKAMKAHRSGTRSETPADVVKSTVTEAKKFAEDAGANASRKKKRKMKKQQVGKREKQKNVSFSLSCT